MKHSPALVCSAAAAALAMALSGCQPSHRPTPAPSEQSTVASPTTSASTTSTPSARASTGTATPEAALGRKVDGHALWQRAAKLYKSSPLLKTSVESPDYSFAMKVDQADPRDRRMVASADDGSDYYEVIYVGKTVYDRESRSDKFFARPLTDEDAAAFDETRDSALLDYMTLLPAHARTYEMGVEGPLTHYRQIGRSSETKKETTLDLWVDRTGRLTHVHLDLPLFAAEDFYVDYDFLGAIAPPDPEDVES